MDGEITRSADRLLDAPESTIQLLLVDLPIGDETEFVEVEGGDRSMLHDVKTTKLTRDQWTTRMKLYMLFLMFSLHVA